MEVLENKIDIDFLKLLDETNKSFKNLMFIDKKNKDDYYSISHIENRPHGLIVSLSSMGGKGPLTCVNKDLDSLFEVVTINDYQEFVNNKNSRKVSKFIYLYNIAKDYFDNVAYDVVKERFTIFIHIKSQEVTNEDNKSTVIEDLVLKITIFDSDDIDDEGTIRIYGERFTLSLPELMLPYNHSHIASGVFNNENNLCFGSTKLSDTFNLLKTLELDVQCENNELLFNMFMLQLNNFLKHESISGGPYSSIHNLNIKKNSIFSKGQSVPGGSIADCVNKCIEDENYIPKLSITPEKYHLSCIVDREHLNSYLLDKTEYVGYMMNGRYTPASSKTIDLNNYKSSISRFESMSGINVGLGESRIVLNKKVIISAIEESMTPTHVNDYLLTSVANELSERIIPIINKK